MYSTPSSLARRTGKFDVNRPTYLKQLAEEYECKSTSEDKKLQVLANLGNFAYDPINYEYIRRFNILDIFINNLKEINLNEIKKVSFSLAAICNLCLDLKNKEHLLKNGIIDLVINCLLNFKQSDEITMNSITILIFLFDQVTQNEIKTNRHLIEFINNLKLTATDKRLTNLAEVFLQDCN